MAEILSYCGYRCDLCPAYYENLTSDEDRKRVRDDWAGYYDYAVEPGEVDCKGCKAGLRDGNPDCKVRPCAMAKGLAICSECTEFGCDKIRKQWEAIRPIAAKHGRSMSPEDYERYIRPYLSEERLRNLRKKA
jgi:hypothetical protein